jgi:hypothetical protein
MQHLLRLAGCAAFLALLFIGGCTLAPDLLVELGLDWWNWPQELRQADAEDERARELADHRQAVDGYKDTKDRICRELIAGRLTLAEATRQVMELPGLTEFMRREIRTDFPGATEEESMSRHVIMWACDLLDLEPARAEALRRRLLAELEGK